MQEAVWKKKKTLNEGLQPGVRHCLDILEEGCG
jgi:hypothetical protein